MKLYCNLTTESRIFLALRRGSNHRFSTLVMGGSGSVTGTVIHSQ